MIISLDQKICIEKILTESLITWNDLFERYNFFASNDINDTNGDIGWDMLNRIAENNKKYRSFIESFPENLEVQREVGNYVHEIIIKKIAEHSDSDVTYSTINYSNSR